MVETSSLLDQEESAYGGSPYPGMWEVVGGGLHRSDYEGQLLDDHDGWHNVLSRIVVPRETDEEVGVTIGTPQFIGDFFFIRNDDVPVAGVRYVAEYVAGDVVLDEEADAYAWITAHEVTQYPLIGSIAEDIRAVDRQIKQWWFVIYDSFGQTIRRLFW